MRSHLLVVMAFMVAAAGCTPSPKSGKGFSLPDGNADIGRETFISLKCNACHKLEGIDQLVLEGEQPQKPVFLGGEVERIKTYGELVTSIINPSHRLVAWYPKEVTSVEGVSKMRNYNDVMTVKQLTDIVTFLETKYQLQPHEPTRYPMY